MSFLCNRGFIIESLLMHLFPLNSTDDMWSWMKEVGLPALYQDENFGENNQRILLGEARLRQIRGQSGALTYTMVLQLYM